MAREGTKTEQIHVFCTKEQKKAIRFMADQKTDKSMSNLLVQLAMDYFNK